MDDDPGAKENQEIYSCCTLVGRRIPLHMDPPSILLVCWLHTGSAPAPAPPSVLIKIHQHKQSQRPTIFYPQQNLKNGVRTTAP